MTRSQTLRMTHLSNRRAITIQPDLKKRTKTDSSQYDTSRNVSFVYPGFHADRDFEKVAGCGMFRILD